MKKDQIEEFIRSLGLDTFGMIPVRRLVESEAFFKEREQKGLKNEFEEKRLEDRLDPRMSMEGAKTIISIAFPYLHEEAQGDNGFSIYTKRKDYHKVVHAYLDAICAKINELGGKASGFVDSNALPERYLAYLAGVGFIGRNNMLITRKYGSYVFLGEVLTDLELECEEKREGKEIKEYKECGECRICYGECPTKSINGAKVDPNICLSYLTQKKELSDQEITLLKGNIFGCDYCQLKCPYNEKAILGVIKDFETLSYMNEETSVYAGMDNKYFKEFISGTSCGWRGKNVLKRNAIIKLAREGKEINAYRSDSPYINGYIERANEKLRKL